MHFEKKFVHLFRTFVERALIPQIKRSEGSMAEWNKFSNMISGDNINFNELQNFVDSLSSQTQTITSYEKLQPPSKKKEEMNDFEFGFNPNKTFGGQKNKLNIFNQNQESERREAAKEESLRNKSGISNSSTLNSLEKLLKVLEQNQQLIQNLGKQNGKDNSSNNHNNSQRISRNQINGQFGQNTAQYQQNYHKGYH